MSLWLCGASARLAGCGTSMRQTELMVEHAPVRLAATLYAPEASAPPPAVLLLHGSGPDGRDNPYYQQLVEAFARRGIAVFVYDKRGSGASSGDWREVPFTALIEDAEAALQQLRRHPWIDSTPVGVWGGSEGATIAALVATRVPSTAFLIVQSMSGLPFGEQYRFQAAREFRGRAADSIAAIALVDTKLSYLRGTLAWSAYDFLARASAGRAFAADASPGVRDSWWWRWYDTKREVSALPALAALRTPVLAVWGADDVLVPADTSAALVRAARASLREEADRILVVPSASHTFHVPGLRGVVAGAGLRNRPVQLREVTAWAATQVRR
jgi:uncharacterized protein